MFIKFLFATLVAPLVSALILNAPTNATSGGPVTITWTSEASDPSVFSLYLNHESFRENLAIQNNVDPAAGTLTITLPAVIFPSGYTLLATNIANITDIYARSPPFSIGATSSVSLSSTATGSSSTLSLRSSTSTSSRSSVIIRPSTTTTPSSNSGLGTPTDTPIPTAASNSVVSRPLDFKLGGIVAVLAICSATILAL